MGVQIVVGHGEVAFVVPHHDGIVQVLDIQHPGPRHLCHAGNLIDLIVEEHIPMVLGQPALVDVHPHGILNAPQRLTIGLVLHIDDAEAAIATEREDHFLSGMVGIGSVVDHGLCIVDVVLIPGPHQRGVQWVVHVDNVQAT